MNESTKRRKKKKYTNPNPLFTKWLTEWKDDAASKGLQSKYVYSRALTSLKMYPLPLSSGKEAKILKNFGDKLCAMLDEKLLKWKNTQNNSIEPQLSMSEPSTSSASSTISKPKVARPKVAKPTVPVQRIVRPKTITAVPVIESESPPEPFIDDEPCFYLFPDCYSIILCVDNAETISDKGKKLFLTELPKQGIPFEVRKLHVGDFLWVARSNATGEELVLDYVIERKRMDDLAKSIKDGRFREQKFRLRNCGLKRPIYLVENVTAKYYGLPEASLEQAIVNTQIMDGFTVKRTTNIRESLSYLTLMTKCIIKKYEGQVLKSASRETVQGLQCSSNTFMEFKEFNCISVKNKSLTVKEMFAKHLLQFFGLSVERAAAIVDNFATPSRLFEAYDNCNTEDEKIKLISSIRFGNLQKPVGTVIGKMLYHVYCAKHTLK